MSEQTFAGESLQSAILRLTNEVGLQPLARSAGEASLLGQVSQNAVDWADQSSLLAAAAVFENAALVAYRRAATASIPDSAADTEDTAESYAAMAHDCLRLIAELRGDGLLEEDGTSSLLIDRDLPVGLAVPLRLAVSGLLARRSADNRLLLGRLLKYGDSLPAVAKHMTVEPDLNWEERLLADAVGAFVLLVRKADGWEDVDRALVTLQQLRSRQEEMQASYLRDAMSEGGREVLVRLVAAFHLVQSVTDAGQYLQSGEGTFAGVMTRLDRHRSQAVVAVESLEGGDRASLLLLVDLLWVGCRELVRNSLWRHVEGVGENMSAFGRSLAARGRPNPVLELWPSQQEALSGNVLDTYRRAVLVQMPTSAGKTLVAEFLIIQSRTLLPNATVAYVVPTRALVNQVTRDLRFDLGPIDMSVEQAVPAFEMDPAEEAMLSAAPDVLVTTPEKLSFLIRRAHPSVANLGLVVVDEAHNLADGERGARLELLLATIKRDRPTARYLLLSPFLPSASELVAWLGDDRALPPVSVNWRPSRRLVGTVRIQGRKPKKSLVFETLDAAGGVDIPGGRQVELASLQGDEIPRTKSIKSVSRAAAKALRPRGATLVLCWGPAFAMDRAAEVAQDESPLPGHPLRDAVISYLRAEYGADFSLATSLARGVAYHHSGMSQEARVLVECLVRRNLVHTVCGTTTLAQGVNFPISNVVIETKRKGRSPGQLTYADLWNIIGRAGRATFDDSGLVAFPAVDDAQVDEWRDFLVDEAEAVASQLSHLIDQADQLTEIGLREVRQIPSLSDMMQFLAHAMRVGGATQTANELEDLLRNSLVYRQADSEPDRADRLVGLCRRYLNEISDKPGTAALSDVTGLSTPSIGLLLAQQKEQPGLAEEDLWRPSHLFGPSVDDLTHRMRVLGQIPELNLGYEEAGTFSPQRAAEILSGWVNGESLSSLADRFGDSDKQGDKRLAAFASYLYGTLTYKASWGLGAMQSAYLNERGPASETAFVPSMVYFGVNSPESVWLRMAGLPRLSSKALGDLWRERIGATPESYREIRQWLGSLTTSDWQLSAQGSELTGEQMQTLWREALA